jgi:hypothetical protein
VTSAGFSVLLAADRNGDLELVRTLLFGGGGRKGKVAPAVETVDVEGRPLAHLCLVAPTGESTATKIMRALATR